MNKIFRKEINMIMVTKATCNRKRERERNKGSNSASKLNNEKTTSLNFFEITSKVKIEQSSIIIGNFIKKKVKKNKTR